VWFNLAGTSLARLKPGEEGIAKSTATSSPPREMSDELNAYL
jgi:hypothetical protein